MEKRSFVCMHIIHKKCWLDKKKDFLQKHRICLEKKKNERKSPFSGKKVLGHKKQDLSEKKRR